MTAQLIDGRAFAATLRARVRERVAALAPEAGRAPGLAVVLVGHDPASEVYVRSKGRQALEAGMKSFEHRLPETTGEDELLALIARLNADDQVHGILVQLPLPAHLDPRAVIHAIAPQKDVDGFHISNVGMVGTGQDAIVPCTPLGVMMMLRSLVDDFRGKTALVIGHSNVVGKPMARLLLNADCTVMVAHKSSTNIPELARMADILVVAAGVPGLVKADWIKPGAVVIDVGINRVDGNAPDGRARLVGDVDFDRARAVAGAITPVPGGVGPMTIACLLANTLRAYCLQLGLPDAPLLSDTKDPE
ncbi:bifunctional methylenetetrahydrofolate dehydrogenase/methenyltetrahydrofolate cyclohydrolase FolD [Poseidonocella sedimentorum]|uniref:Bifunctional protein FolD n=1 Tax=Poseidonocella sedimentorum TaxID=871652 RepID=A0A1I6E2U8_9RHOB|nr:bifunctional methylenetetrahydrofolate dehydrogenase/methenyltetrahydrofolate cyclohydrolase FolD [Poseidonocella sedimentorum]SFR12026.1 methenyltetrahydrofolate cyclohydrolase /5,10-methylenetetrahydrofolate dehydrogenase (NADP+) [Poseidonocella sedimentorum]